MAEITDLHKMNNSQFMNKYTNKDWMKNNTINKPSYTQQLIYETPHLTGIQYNNRGYNTLKEDNSLRRRKYNDELCMYTKYQQITSIGKLFFSSKNIDLIYDLILKQIQTKLHIKSFVKNDNSLAQHMIYIFNNYAPGVPDTKGNVDILNKVVVNSVYPIIISDIKQQKEYLKCINTPFEPIDLPLATSVKGRKTNIDYISKITNY